MSRATAPTLHCDDEGCDAWEIDEYEICADSVNGIRITSTRRAVGWLTVNDEDFCPEHASTHPTEQESTR